MSRQRVPNEELFGDTARENLLTNGGFEIWQRGVAPITYGHSADRWELYSHPGGTISFEPDFTQQDVGSVVCMLTRVNAYVSAFGQIQKIEHWKALKGRTVSFSMRVKTSAANGINISIYDGISQPTSANHTGSGNYETLTVTSTIAANATCLWAFVRYLAVGNYYLDNAMLVLGSVPAEYVPLHPAEDLIRCQRYYELIGDDSSIIMSALAYSGAQFQYYFIPFRVEKAVTPTITIKGTIPWPNSNSNATSPAYNTTGKQGLRVSCGSAATGMYYVSSSATQHFIAEANP